MRRSNFKSRNDGGTGVVGALVLSILLPAILFAALPVIVFAERIDHIVAAVNNSVITARDLEQAVSINEVFSGPAADRTRLMIETREGLINRLLLLQEARRLKFVEVSDQEVRAEAEAFKNRLGSEEALAAFLARNGLAGSMLQRMLGEALLVRRFVEKKLGLFVRVTRDEAQRYFDSHPSEFAGRQFPEVQKQITVLLTDQLLGRQVDQYLADLRSKAEIRINPL